MKIWAISDLHFSHDNSRTMDNFGTIWNDHETKIRKNWRYSINAQDLVLIGGDISWARNLSNSLIDLEKISCLPGSAKIMIKGNHDQWWNSYDKLCQAVPKNILPIQGNAIKIKEHIFCGTRGWLAPNDPCFDNLDQKTFKKEINLLKKSLDAAMELKPEQGMHVLMHFPPFTTHGQETPFFDIIKQYPVTSCSYGHFHFKKEWEKIPKGLINNISFNLTSSDFLNHQPTEIW